MEEDDYCKHQIVKVMKWMFYGLFKLFGLPVIIIVIGVGILYWFYQK